MAARSGESSPLLVPRRGSVGGPTGHHRRRPRCASTATPPAGLAVCGGRTSCIIPRPAWVDAKVAASRSTARASASSRAWRSSPPARTAPASCPPAPRSGTRAPPRSRSAPASAAPSAARPARTPRPAPPVARRLGPHGAGADDVDQERQSDPRVAALELVDLQPDALLLGVPLLGENVEVAQERLGDVVGLQEPLLLRVGEVEDLHHRVRREAGE